MAPVVLIYTFLWGVDRSWVMANLNDGITIPYINNILYNVLQMCISMKMQSLKGCDNTQLYKTTAREWIPRVWYSNQLEDYLTYWGFIMHGGNRYHWTLYYLLLLIQNSEHLKINKSLITLRRSKMTLRDSFSSWFRREQYHWECISVATILRL